MRIIGFVFHTGLSLHFFAVVFSFFVSCKEFYSIYPGSGSDISTHTSPSRVDMSYALRMFV